MHTSRFVAKKNRATKAYVGLAVRGVSGLGGCSMSFGKKPFSRTAKGAFPIHSARVAKLQKTVDGKRIFGPFHIKIEVQFTPLNETSETLDFYLYQRGPQEAVDVVVKLLLPEFYTRRLKLSPPWPRPVGTAKAATMKDAEFAALLKSMRAGNGVVLTKGEVADPTAFHHIPNQRFLA